MAPLTKITHLESPCNHGCDPAGECAHRYAFVICPKHPLPEGDGCGCYDEAVLEQLQSFDCTLLVGIIRTDPVSAYDYEALRRSALDVVDEARNKLRLLMNDHGLLFKDVPVQERPRMMTTPVEGESVPLEQYIELEDEIRQFILTSNLLLQQARSEADGTFATHGVRVAALETLHLYLARFQGPIKRINYRGTKHFSRSRKHLFRSSPAYKQRKMPHVLVY